jgi:RNA polymerase sigma-70 factor (ECF subfamily)
VPSPVVALNRAVAVSMASGPDEALRIVDELQAGGALDTYHLLHAIRGELLRRLNRAGDAARAFERALELTTNKVERTFLERRLEEVDIDRWGDR